MPKRKTICTAFLLPLTLTGWSLHCTAQKELSWVGGTVFVFGDVFEAGGTVRHRFLGSYNIVVFLTICISYANNCFTL